MIRRLAEVTSSANRHARGTKRSFHFPFGTLGDLGGRAEAPDHRIEQSSQHSCDARTVAAKSTTEEKAANASFRATRLIWT